MEFWAVEVKAGEPFKVELPEKRAVHLSQVSIGEVKKDMSVSICLFVNVNGKKFTLGTLNSEKVFQQSFDLVFDKTFELSHNWKDGSIFFLGYTADNGNSDPASDKNDSDTDSVEESSESDDDIPVIAPNGGPATEVKQKSQKVSAGKDSAADKQKAKIVEPKKDASSDNTDDSSDDDIDETSSEDEPKVSVKKDSAAEKQKVKIVEPRKDVSSDDTDDSIDDDETSSEDDPKVSAKGSAAGKQKTKIGEPKNDADSSDDDAMSEDDSEDDEDNKIASADEDSDSDEDDESPVQVKSSKKRASVSASNAAVPQKKAKLTTPPKTDGKKSFVHVDTPYPSKQAGKTFANKPNQQTPKTDGSHSCTPCKRTFKSEVALESHNKAKHSGGK